MASEGISVFNPSAIHGSEYNLDHDEEQAQMEAEDKAIEAGVSDSYCYSI